MLRSAFGRPLVVILALAGCDEDSRLIDVPPTLALSSTLVSPVAPLGGQPATATVTIVNGTEGTLEGLAATVQYGAGATGWLGATLDRTTATRDQAATLSLRATPGALGQGLYQATVLLAAAGAGNSPVTIAVRFTVAAPPASKLAMVTEPSPTATNGAPLARQPVVQLLDGADQPVAAAGVTVTAAVGTGGGQIAGPGAALTDAQGRATFSGLGLTGPAGPKTLVFSAPNLASVTSAVIDLSAGPAARLEAATATTQTADAGTPVATAPRVRVVDDGGNPVAGITVTFTASAGSAIAPAGPFVTGADGTAGPTSWTLAALAGGNSVTAAAAGLAGSPVRFDATGRVGPAAVLVKQSGDNLVGLVGTALGTPHVAKVADGFGNGVAGVTVSWGVTGGGSVAPPTSVTDAAGLVQATRTLPGAAGAGTTTATATIAGAPVTVAFAVTAATNGPGRIVKVAGDAQSGTVATTLGNPIRVRVFDLLDAPLAGVTVTFTTGHPGGGFPGGAAITTDAGGFAETTWRLGNLPGAQTAEAAVGGPAPAVFTATATTGPLSPTQSTIAAAPASFPAGGSTTITVTALDAGGNPVAGLPVTLAVTGTATLTQPAAATDAQGRATGSLTATAAGAKVVSATVSGIALAQTATVTVTAGAPTTIVPVTATTLGVRFGEAVTPSPAVQVRDQHGNGVPGVPVTFAITAGQSAVVPGSTVTGANGIAAVSAWAIAPLLTGPNPDNVYNRLQATAGVGVAGNPVTFEGTATVSFVNDLIPFLTGNCLGGGCHSVQVPNYGDPPAAVYAFLLDPSQRYVIPGDSTTNAGGTALFWRKPGGAVPHTGGVFPANLITVIKAWIRQGALQN